MPTNAQLLARIHRKAASLTPDARALYLRAFRMISQSLSTREFAEAIRLGHVDQLLNTVLSDDVLAAGPLATFRANVVATANGAATSAFSALPFAVKGAGAFNELSPQVLNAVGSLQSRVVKGLSSEVRETVRAHIMTGLTDGQTPTTIARGIRDVVGLAPNQELAVENFRRALLGGDKVALRARLSAAMDAGDTTLANELRATLNAGNPLTRALRDRRFDRTLRKGKPLTTAQVDKMTNAYRRRWIAHNANTQARTFALDAQRVGQQNAWQSAIDDGLADPNLVERTWITTMDGKERPEHAAMNGAKAPWGEPYSNGQTFPGETDYNCRCIERITHRREKKARPATTAPTPLRNPYKPTSAQAKMAEAFGIDPSTLKTRSGAESALRTIEAADKAGFDSAVWLRLRSRIAASLE